MKSWLYFDTMLTPKLITFVYWLLLLAAALGGLGAMFSGYDGFTFGKMLMGLFFAASGALGARIWCELMIVMFKINEALQEMRNK